MPDAPAPRPPLAGVRVLDLGIIYAGPYGSMLLADWGAEVIRLENVNVFQPQTRGYQPGPPGTSWRPSKAGATATPTTTPAPAPGTATPSSTATAATSSA